MSTEVLGGLTFIDSPTAGGIGLVLNTNGVPSLVADITANRPAAGNTGRLFVDTTLSLLQRDNGTSWDTISPVVVYTGTTNQIGVSGSVISLSNDATLPGTGAVVLPTGTTAQRPGTPTTGATRWNSTLGYHEVYNGAVWTRQGQVIQTVTGSIAASNGTGVQLAANAVPLVTGGSQIWTQSFTPVSAASRIAITFDVNAGNSVASNRMVLSVFAGSTCIGANHDTASATANNPFSMGIELVYSPGSTAAITFSARFGGVSAGTTFWSQSSSSTLGGALVTQYMIQEIL